MDGNVSMSRSTDVHGRKLEQLIHRAAITSKPRPVSASIARFQGFSDVRLTLRGSSREEQAVHCQKSTHVTAIEVIHFRD